jgi:hypothetical protein
MSAEKQERQLLVAQTAETPVLLDSEAQSQLIEEEAMETLDQAMVLHG